MRMLCWPAKSPLRASRRLPGGTRKSLKASAAESCVSLRRAIRWISAGNRREPLPFQIFSVSLSQKSWITVSSYNAARYSATAACGKVRALGSCPLILAPALGFPHLAEACDRRVAPRQAAVTGFRVRLRTGSRRPVDASIEASAASARQRPKLEGRCSVTAQTRDGPSHHCLGADSVVQSNSLVASQRLKSTASLRRSTAGASALPAHLGGDGWKPSREWAVTEYRPSSLERYQPPSVRMISNPSASFQDAGDSTNQHPSAPALGRQRSAASTAAVPSLSLLNRLGLRRSFGGRLLRCRRFARRGPRRCRFRGVAWLRLALALALHRGNRGPDRLRCRFDRRRGSRRDQRFALRGSIAHHRAGDRSGHCADRSRDDTADDRSGYASGSLFRNRECVTGSFWGSFLLHKVEVVWITFEQTSHATLPVVVRLTCGTPIRCGRQPMELGICRGASLSEAKMKRPSPS